MNNFILPHVSRPPFVGRRRELSELTQALELVGGGRGGIVLIAGEPGIGKTRLLLELSDLARLRGCHVLIGHADEAESMQPYLPFVDALQNHVRAHTLESLLAELRPGALEATSLIPELGSDLKDLLERRPPDSVDAAYRLRASIATFLLSIAGATPKGLVLCLDDLQWADRSSLLLLQHLARHVADAPVLIAGAYRAEGLDAAHPLSDTLAELSRARVFQRLPLGPLSFEEATQLIEGLNGAPVASAVTEAIYRQSEGNAFFLEELVRHLQAERRELADPETANADWGIPEGVHHVLAKRLSRLRSETRAMLQAAAVIGRTFSFDVLLRISGLDLTMLADAIDEAMQAGMIREQGEAYSFAHSLLQEELYRQLNIPRRQLLNLRVAEAMEAAGSQESRPQIAALVTHFRLAGGLADPEKVLGYCLRAGEMARAVHAYEEATVYCHAALEMMERVAVEPERRAALLERAGILTVDTGLDVEKGVQYQELALALYTELGLTQQAARVHSRLAEQLSGYPMRDISRALEHYRAAETLLAREPEPAFLGNVYAGLAFAAYWTVRTEDGLAASRRAMEIADDQDNRALWAAAAASHGWHLCVAGDLSSGQLLIEQAWQVADSIDHSVAAFQAAFLRFGVALEIVYDPINVPLWCELEPTKPRLSHSLRMRRVLGQYRCIRRVLMGELAPSRDEVQGGFSEPYQAFYSGEWERAETLWTQGRTRLRDDRWDKWRCTYWLSRVLRMQGRRAEATRLLEDDLRPVVESQAVAYELQFRSALALLSAETGSTDEAQLHLARCREILAPGEDWRAVAGRVALAEGVTAGALGNLREAETQFSQAVDVFRNCGLPWEEAEALHLWGRMYVAAGRRHRSRAMAKFSSAIEVYRRHEASQRWIDYVLADELRTLGKGSPPAYPDGLSERESQVLRLIAAGKSNREIAEALTISLNTVFHHVTSIFNKTGSANRTAAAIYAHREGLVH